MSGCPIEPDCTDESHAAEPPAGAQQDDAPNALDLLADALVETEDDEGWVHAREVLDWLGEQGWELRPSADAEALRRVRELADELGRDSWNVTADPMTRERTHIADRLRAALDGDR